MIKKTKYKNGKPFNGLITPSLIEAKKRIKEMELPCAILVVAPPGKGKTTLAVHLAEEYRGGKPIDFKKSIGNGFEHFNKLLAESREDEETDVLIYDDAGDIDKFKFMSDMNFKIRRILQLYRQGNQKLLIMCLQDFSNLDSSILNLEVIQFMYYIPQRHAGYADYWCYSLNRMFWLLHHMQKFSKARSRAYRVVNPNYYGHFLNLEPKRSDELKEYSIIEKNKHLDKLAGVNKDFEDVNDMSLVVGRQVRWVKGKLNEKGIKPVAKGKHGKSLYPKGTAEALTK